MSLPRQVLPGSDYMITRRCSERRFFLRSDHDTNNAFVYCLALAALRAKVELLFVVAMSNVDIVFPHGTYWMRRFAHVLCESGSCATEPIASPSEATAPA